MIAVLYLKYHVWYLLVDGICQFKKKYRLCFFFTCMFTVSTVSRSLVVTECMLITCMFVISYKFVILLYIPTVHMCLSMCFAILAYILL